MVPTETLQADEILERMAMVRQRIDEQSDEVVAQVTELSDWRSYVRRHPWVSVGAAAALGFILVPSRKKADAESSTLNTKEQPAAFATDDLRSVLVGAAKRAFKAYASRSLGDVASSFLAANDKG